MTEGSKKAIIAAFFANLGIVIAEFIGFLITRSAGMLADSVHSFAETGNQGLLILGGNRAQRDATREHPCGYGRERYSWSSAEVSQAIDVTEANVPRVVPTARMIYVEPDLKRLDDTPPADTGVAPAEH